MAPLRMTDLTHIDVGLAEGGEYSAQEAADCKAWLKRIADERAFDEEARKAYARDRCYARGDSSHEVNVPLLASFIDILVAFIYAHDPDVDVLPADRVSGDRASRMVQQQSVQDVRALAQTLELVVSRLLRDGRLKRQVRRAVRSALTIGIGWLKGSWQERQGQDPHVAQQIRDIQDDLQRTTALLEEVEEGQGDLDAKKATLEQQLQGLEAQLEVTIARGFYIDLVPAEDMVIPSSVGSVLDYQSAPWIAQRFFMRPDDAKAQFPRIKDKLPHATTYRQRKPAAMEDRKTPTIRQFSAEDAESYEKGKSEDGGLVCGFEVWNAETNTVLTLIEGLDCYAKEPFQPTPASSRFYPFFALALTEVDGERHPQSMVGRSIRLIDEINRAMTAWVEHRRRIKPGVVFNEKALTPASAKKLAGAVTQEYVGVKVADATGAEYDMRRLLVPKTYAQVDASVYDTMPPRRLLEDIWGISEALAGSVQVAKTATEAEIQQSGTQARTGAMRDAQEDMLGELAQFCAEVALGALSLEDAREIAGPEAFWPESIGVEGLRLLVSVDIRAGSTGKPNTTKKQEAWASTMPLLQGLVMQIAQLRMSDPTQVADCLEELAVETVDRTGDRMDITRFMPGQPTALPVDPATGMPAAPAPMGAPMPAEAAPEGEPAGVPV